MSIHHEHPFQPPAGDRNQVRRLRGRLPAPVTVWTAGQGDDRAGLTVSSLLVVDGEPGSVIAVLDPLADVWDTLRATSRCVINVLGWRHRQLADAFGYTAPAPGGPFRLAEWTATEWGPALVGADGWAGCRLADREPVEVGWGIQLQLTIDKLSLDDPAESPAPLVHRRGRYATF